MAVQLPNDINKVISYSKKRESRLHGYWEKGEKKKQNSVKDSEYM